MAKHQDLGLSEVWIVKSIKIILCLYASLLILLYPVPALAVVPAGSAPEFSYHKASGILSFGFPFGFPLGMIVNTAGDFSGRQVQVAQVSRGAALPVVPFTPEELDLLARLIWVEARGEPFEVQIGVAAVVINRVQSSIFPNTIHDVIYQRGQFPPVYTSKIEHPASPSTLRAAKQALLGEDPTGGALYYNAASTRSSFFRSRPGQRVIGGMLFTR